MIRRFGAHLGLLVIGTGWGATVPLGKVAVSTGLPVLGLITVQLIIGALFMGGILILRRAPMRLPMDWPALRIYALVASLGTLLPNSASYTAAVHLPAGILSVLIATVAMFSFPICLIVGLDRFSWRRLLGLALGLVSVVLLAQPASDGAFGSGAIFYMALSMCAALLYAFEGISVALLRPDGLGPMRLLFGSSVLGALICLPAALQTGALAQVTSVFGVPQQALVASSIIHICVYAGYVALVGCAGAVFAAQVSYVVTASGVIWAMILLGERFSPWFWAALCLMLAGMAMVQPRPKEDTPAAP